MLVRSKSGIFGGGELGNHATQRAGLADVGGGSIVVAGERNFTRPAMGGNGFTIRRGPAGRKLDLLLFILAHLLVVEVIFALIILPVFFA
ncbi:hypothetical protein D3C78_1463190 [compost metagenome]